MNGAERELERELGGYADFLRKRRLTPPRHQPHLVRWVREFLNFAAEHRGYTFEQTPDLFLTASGERAGIGSWQIRRAADAVCIYTVSISSGCQRNRKNEIEAGNSRQR